MECPLVMNKEVFPNSLPRAETKDLLAKFSGFRFCKTDGLTLRYVWNYREQADEQGTVHNFTLSNSMGSGGSALHGTTDIAVDMLESVDQTYEHILIQPKSVPNRIRHFFFSEGKSVDSPAKWLAQSESENPFPSSTRNVIVRFEEDENFECMDNLAVVWKYGRKQTRLATVAAKVAETLLQG